VTWLKQHKWYLIHGALIAVGFLTPSVQAFAAQHQAYSAGILLVYGWLLHWLDGQQAAQPANPS
jgi:hypothetical protein